MDSASLFGLRFLARANPGPDLEIVGSYDPVEQRWNMRDPVWAWSADPTTTCAGCTASCNQYSGTDGSSDSICDDSDTDDITTNDNGS